MALDQSSSTDTTARPVIFGEVLYDVFDGDQEVLGGAAFNVAWNLQGLGCRPLFVSRVGQDLRGDLVFQAMEDWGMDTSGVQRDPDRPTGTVEVKVQGGQPRYTIVERQAYDSIDGHATVSAASSSTVSFVYHGTLALREETSRRALTRLLAETTAPRFIDLNLREPWYNQALIAEILRDAAWAKVNDDELHNLCGSDSVDEPALRQVQTRHGVKNLLVTRGEDGACLLTAGGEYCRAATPTVPAIQDTVGAGDAFSAVMLVGLSRRWAPQQTLERAANFAASICGIRGATSTEPALYRGAVASWTESPGSR